MWETCLFFIFFWSYIYTTMYIFSPVSFPYVPIWGFFDFCFVKTFLALEGAPGSSCVFSAPVLQSAISLRSLSSFNWRMILEANT